MGNKKAAAGNELKKFTTWNTAIKRNDLLKHDATLRMKFKDIVLTGRSQDKESYVI